MASLGTSTQDKRTVLFHPSANICVGEVQGNLVSYSAFRSAWFRGHLQFDQSCRAAAAQILAISAPFLVCDSCDLIGLQARLDRVRH
jgi:hypothetical protein